MRNPQWFLAFRYLVSRNKPQAIQVISWVSTLGLAAGTFALVVVLSVFNGFEGLVVRLYHTFDAELKVVSETGKTLKLSEDQLKELRRLEGVRLVQPVLEEKVLFRKGNQEVFGILKGTDVSMLRYLGLGNHLTEGTLSLGGEQVPLCLLGSGVSAQLQASDQGGLVPVQVHAANSEADGISITDEPFRVRAIRVAGVYSVQQEYDAQVVLVPFDFAREVLNLEDACSYLEFAFSKGKPGTDLEAQLEKILGQQVLLLDRYKQHAFVYKIMQAEKWMVFFILVFILLVAAFNLTGCLRMLALDKAADARILGAMGAAPGWITGVFFRVGLLIAGIGGTLGMVVGWLVCLGQDRFGWLTLGDPGAFVVSTYPIELRLGDFFFTALALAIVAIFASWVPIRKAFSSSRLS
jgi:lipoprotein-releasing system permease protein